jgi:hypothetical protein
MNRFTLRKTYLDVVDSAGRCAIVYWTDLRWGPIALHWEGLSLEGPGREPEHQGAFGRSLGVRTTCEAWCAPFATRLLDLPAGTLDWRCEAPGADVVVESRRGVSLCGAGYRETLVLSIPPWKLPIDELHWGRWASPESRHSVVWLDWRGSHPLTLVLENGVVRDDAEVGDESIRIGGETLRLAGTRTLYSRTIAEILRDAGPLIARLPGSWRALDDRKSLSTGTLGDRSGWAVHEIVRFP